MGLPKTEPAHGFSAAANTLGCRGSIWFHDIVDRCFATVSTSAEGEGPARASTPTANDPAIGYNLHATLARMAVGPPPNQDDGLI
jgi:hypothetical protein